MNTNKSYKKATVSCIQCHYTKNSARAKHCRKCGSPLTSRAFANSKYIGKIDFVSWGFLALIALSFLLFGGFGYYYGQQLRSPTLSSNLNRSSDSNSSDKSSSDIQVYNSMKEVPNVPKGTFNYGSALPFAALTAHGTHEAINKAHPNFHLHYYISPGSNNPGHATGISMLLNGDLSFAQAAAPLKDDAYSKAKERGFSLQQVPVAIDGILLFAHPDFSIPGLSVEEIRDIYKGKITNWKQVGGPDLAITAFTINPKIGTIIAFLLGSELSSLSPKVRFMRDYTDGVRKVSSLPGAIGVSYAGAVLGQRSIRPLAIKNGNSYIQPFTSDGKINTAAFKNGTYPLTKRLFIVIRRDGTPDEAAGVAYANLLLSKEGQQYIEQSGLTPIH